MNADFERGVRAVIALFEQSGMETTARQIEERLLNEEGSYFGFVPLTWRCKDYADGWITFRTAEDAWAYAQEHGSLIQVTYGRRTVHPSIKCLRCNLTSYNLNDIKHRFCARCGFHEDFELAG